MIDKRQLIVKSRYNNKIEPLNYISRDGWVIGRHSCFGDNAEDCDILLDTKEYLKSVRKKYKMSQQEMSWVLGISRPTYSALERGNKTRELTLREYLIIESINIEHLPPYLPDLIKDITQ